MCPFVAAEDGLDLHPPGEELAGALGGATGIGLGWGVSMLLPGINPNFPTSVSGTSIVLAFGVSALVGLISGILPAIRAARLEPVEALRSER